LVDESAEKGKAGVRGFSWILAFSWQGLSFCQGKDGKDGKGKDGKGKEGKDGKDGKGRLLKQFSEQGVLACPATVFAWLGDYQLEIYLHL
jgi:hypothetical protein